jgi:very-short-patch-repair endonuclease
MNNVRFDYDFVFNYFKNNNCQLLSKEYKNNKTKLTYICKCGNESSITFSNFKDKNVRCRKCSGCEKYTYEQVFNIFKNRNCILISNNYKDVFSKLTFKCQCGIISKTSLHQFMKGIGCMKCTGSEKLTYEFVKNFFEKYNYQLLSKEYKNTMTKLDFKCNNGHINNMEFMSFQKGHRCSMCRNKTEQIINKFLTNEYKNIVYQVKFEWCKNQTYLPFDFLLQEHKLIIEIDGKQHFEHFRKNWKTPEEIQERDILKMKLALENGYSIIRISQEDVFNNTIDWKNLLRKNIKTYKIPKVTYISKDSDLYINYKI